MEASIGCVAGDGMGGGIFAKTAKTPPLQSALRSVSRPKAAIGAAFMYHAHPACLPPMGPYGLYNDAARRVATVFE